MTQEPRSSPPLNHAHGVKRVTVHSQSEEQTMALAARIALVLRPGDIVTLEGPLGSGKTCFVRGLARGLGIDPSSVSSPTFIIRQEYVSSSGVILTHLDGYRLNGPEDLESIGWDELIESAASIVAIEWPSRFGEALAKSASLAVAFEHVSVTERELTFEIAGDALESIWKAIANGEKEE
jgi:tRNA threonylcarbamoyladenosine biosynthesis protein TsaE